MATYHIDSEKLTQVTEIVNRETDPAATESLIESEICADWNEGDEHQDWIDTASSAEIADWIASFYSGYEQIVHDEIAANGTSSRFMGHGLDPETGAYDAFVCVEAVQTHAV